MARSSTTRSAASTRRCGTSRAGRPGCPSISSSAARRARPSTATRTRAAAEIPEVLDNARAIMGRGFRHVRVQVGVPGMAGYGSRRGEGAVAALHDAPCSSRWRTRGRARALEAARKELGDEVELLHDVHERVSPTQALAVLQGRRALPALLPRGPALPRGHRLVPSRPPELHDPHRDGRALQQPARVDTARRRAAHRLRPRARLAGGRPHAVPEDGGGGRDVRRQDRVARPRRRLARRPRVQRRPRPRVLELRDPGVGRASTTRRARSSRAAPR